MTEKRAIVVTTAAVLVLLVVAYLWGPSSVPAGQEPLLRLSGTNFSDFEKAFDDPGRSSSDVQRCTDVALDNANIHFHFDNLEARRRLSVAAHPVAVAITVRGIDAAS